MSSDPEVSDRRADRGVRSAEYGVPSTEYRVPTTEYEVRSNPPSVLRTRYFCTRYFCTRYFVLGTSYFVFRCLSSEQEVQDESDRLSHMGTGGRCRLFAAPGSAA